VEFRVLGPLAIADGARQVPLGTPRQRALLALLVAAAPRAVAYDRLAEQLWSRNAPASARHTIQGYAHRLRVGLGDNAHRLQTEPDGYRLDIRPGELDAEAFAEGVDQGRRELDDRNARAAASTLEDALSLWRGRPFEDIDDVGDLEVERARLEGLRLAAMEERCEAELSLGRHQQLVDELERLVSDHPYRERFWGHLMVARYRSGRQADALEAFRRVQSLLAEDLGIEPGPALSRLHERILLQDPMLEHQPAAAAPSPRPTAVPAARDELVGRQRELDALDGFVRCRRLITVTGAPGVGKSRLALEVARRLAREQPDDVAVTQLASVSDPADVPAVIAEAVGAPITGGRSALEAAIEHLRGRRLLMIVDNFDHVAAAAVAISALLDAAPGLVVVATSRQPLHLTGEQDLHLRPLDTERHDLSTDAPADAVALFVARAREVDSSFRLHEDNRDLVDAIVARLDGLPLAIELAAARVRSLPLGELLEQLDATSTPVTDLPDRPHHHRGLRATIDWSLRLLDDRHRLLIRRLGVFRGGITVDDAEAVIGFKPVDDILGGLERLVEASLVMRPADEDPARWTLLQTIRAHAEQLLRDHGEWAEVAERHARHHAAVVAATAPALTQAGRGEAAARLDELQADLRGALDATIELSLPDPGLDLASGLWRWWQLRGLLVEGRRRLEAALDLEGGTTAACIRATLGLAGICYWQGDLEAAESAYRGARADAHGLDEWLEVEALFGLVTTLACRRGDLVEAEPVEQEIQALVAALADPVAIGLGLATGQLVRLAAGELEASRELGERCLEGTRQLGERWYELQVLRTLALTSRRQERWQQADDELRECLRIGLELGDRPGLALDLERLSRLRASREDLEVALVLSGAATALRESAGVLAVDEAFRWEQPPAADLANAALDELTAARAVARGRTLDLQQVVAEAVGA